jgi:hypothetical protein
VAVGIMFVAFALIAQFAVWQYGQGAVQAAADDAAQVVSAYGADPNGCRQAFEDARSDLLGGSLGRGVGEPRCLSDGEFVEVVVPVTFHRWLPFSFDWSFEVRAAAAVERVGS